MADQPKHKPLSASPFFDDGRAARPLVPGTVPRGRMAVERLAVSKASSAFPFPVTLEMLERGEQRFNIYCSVCHGRLGDGDGMVVRRGFRHPPSFHTDRLRGAPVGHFFDVITNGFGAMPDYAAQIPPGDRWAIIAYVRALQLSQNFSAADLSAEILEKLRPQGAWR